MEDKSILEDFDIKETKITDDVNPDDIWHIHKVWADEDQIRKLSKVLKPQKWYAHFWDEEVNLFVVYRDKVFSFHKDDENGRREAIDYGLFVGIPLEQLDFLIE